MATHKEKLVDVMYTPLYPTLILQNLGMQEYT